MKLILFGLSFAAIFCAIMAKEQHINIEGRIGCCKKVAPVNPTPDSEHISPHGHEEDEDNQQQNQHDDSQQQQETKDDDSQQQHTGQDETQQQSQQKWDVNQVGQNEDDCEDGKGTKGGKCNNKGEKQLRAKRSFDGQQTHQQTQQNQENWDVNQIEQEDDCEDGKGTKGGKCNNKGEKGTKRHIVKRSHDALEQVVQCNAPESVKVELFDKFKLLPNTELVSQIFEKTKNYGLKWEGDRVFQVDPHVKYHIVCEGGVTADKEFDYDDETTDIEQNITVDL